MFDLKQLDLELGLDDDPLDDPDYLDPDEAEFMARDIAEYGSLAELEAFIGLPASAVIRETDGAYAVRKCLDCSEPARPRKSANGPWPKRCEEHTKARRKYMVSGGSKVRPQYRQCCVTWQLDPDPSHRGLCQQCRDARKASRKPVSDREATWLANTLGPSGWNIQKPGWLRE
jgi:hypothetical protein